MNRVFVENGITKCRDNRSLCCFCNDLIFIANDTEDMLKHLNEAAHRKLADSEAWHQIPQTKQLEEIKSLSEADYSQLVLNNIDFTRTLYFCNYCCKKLNNFVSVKDHISGEEHQLNMKVNLENLFKNDIIYRKKRYFCLVCKYKYKGTNSAEQHINGEKHKEFKEKRDKRTTEIDEKTTRVRDSCNKYSFNKIILQYGGIFLPKCIEPGEENIYNFTTDEINLMQLGISLIVPFGNKGFCIPCAYEIKLDLQELYKHLQNEVHIENMCDLKSSGDFSDENELSHLDLAKLGLFEKSDEEIKCLMCDLTFPNTNDDIKLHQTKDHASKIMSWKQAMKKLNDEFFLVLGEFWYYAARFYCDICKLKIKTEMIFIEHLEKTGHLKELQSVEKNYKINKCFTCQSCWYGMSDYIEHCKSDFHNNQKHQDELFPKIKTNDYYMFKDPEISKSYVSESDDDLRFRKLNTEIVLQDIENIAKMIYPEAKAYMFGSRSSYLSLYSSDIDVFLDCENVYNDVGSKEASQNYIRKLRKRFFNDKTKWKWEDMVLQAKVPILTLEHRPTRTKCDLSFMNGLGVEKTQLLRSFVLSYQRCRELILYLKKWFGIFDLYGSRAVSAHAISWFAIFYLQVEGIFPSVYQLIKQNNQSKIVAGWECGFPKEITVSDKASKYTFNSLLQGFFSYYANFDYHIEVACPLIGKVIKKRDFGNIKDMPKEMEIYKNRFMPEELEYFPYDCPMCIQDPIDLSMNITKNIKKHQLRMFRHYCHESLKLL